MIAVTRNDVLEVCERAWPEYWWSVEGFRVHCTALGLCFEVRGGEVGYLEADDDEGVSPLSGWCGSVREALRRMEQSAAREAEWFAECRQSVEEAK